jgi:ABC-type oligopeptide transport system ATPase subunit
MSISHSVYDVFTPTTQAQLNFVPRDAVNDQLVDALFTPGKQLIVYGESGSGKSTLLLNKLKDTHAGHITTRCTAATTYNSLILDAFDQLNPYYTNERSTKRSKSVSPALAAQFAIVRAEINASASREGSETQARVLPPQLTAQRLADFLGAQGMCWVVEDFHKMRSDEKLFFSQSLKVFCDMSATYPEVKVVCIGASETARQVIEYDSEMRTRVAEIQVPLMTDDELTEIILNGQDLLNIDLTALLTDIVQYSVGVPSICHQLALNACVEKHVFTTRRKRVEFTEDDLKASVEHYVRDSSDTLRASFNKALRRHKVRKYDNCRLILTVLAKGPIEGMLYAEILAGIKAIAPDYPAGNLTSYLRQLMQDDRGSIVKHGSDQKYRFADPLYHTFAQLTLARASKDASELSPMVKLVAESLGTIFLSYSHHTQNDVDIIPVLSTPVNFDFVTTSTLANTNSGDMQRKTSLTFQPKWPASPEKEDK